MCKVWVWSWITKKRSEVEIQCHAPIAVVKGGTCNFVPDFLIADKKTVVKCMVGGKTRVVKFVIGGKTRVVNVTMLLHPNDCG